MELSKSYIVENLLIKKNAKVTLTEKLHTYDYLFIDATTFLDKTEAEVIHKFQSNLDTRYIYFGEHEQGIERSLHTTLFYGLIPNAYNYKLIKLFIDREIETFDLTIKGISFFRENPLFDVMKFEVESEAMQKVHAYIKDTMDNEDTHDLFQPHMTLAYIKKGAFSEWEGYDNFSFCNSIRQVKEIVYQDVYDTKRVIYQ